MKLTPAQFATLHMLAERGPQQAREVLMPPAVDGSKRVKLEWNVASSLTLAKLEEAKLVHVKRVREAPPTDALGKRGHQRRALTIEITEAGRQALAAA